MRDTMGIIFTESDDVTLRELTELRSTAALPIAGRYRLIDFVLSGMVNSGIINVGVATKYKYSSLMDHLGAGSAYDLMRENYGLFVLPPYASHKGGGTMAGEIDILMGIMPYLRRSRQKYVVLCEGNMVCNLTFYAAMEQHKKTGADVTILYREETPEKASRFLVMEMAEDGRVTGLEYKPRRPKGQNVGMHMYIMEKELLIRICEGCAARGEHSFIMDALIKNAEELRLFGWKYDGYVGCVDSVQSYFACNMDVLKGEVRDALFGQRELIFTKVKNRVPTRYGNAARVSDSLVADGCVIEGVAENCVLFRGVKVGKNTHLKNCVVMEKTHIDIGCEAENVIFDKECLMREGKRLIGQADYPVIIRKGTVI